MSERMEKSGLDEVLEHRGLKAITDKKKIKNGMVYDYDFDITVIACYAEWTDNY